jgi:hypothetical protein
LTRTSQTKRPKKPTPEYEEGPKAQQNFEGTMKALFRASKVSSEKKDKD